MYSDKGRGNVRRLWDDGQYFIEWATMVLDLLVSTLMLPITFILVLFSSSPYDPYAE